MYHDYVGRQHTSERACALTRPQGFIAQLFRNWSPWRREPLRHNSGVTGRPLQHQAEQAITSFIQRLVQTRRSEL
jgi:hypothetical protein